jgi:hypothetical protein
MNEALNDERITGAVTPEVLAFLIANQPDPDTTDRFQVGHWMGVTAAVCKGLAEARQRIRELEADA